ncbi:hypothetical protein MBLNU459_g1973t1 [Dothideomycetes sp. NU459]
MASSTNQYIRQVLHHQESPPAVQARFFYTSPLAIDDPLSPLPPPAVAGATVSRAPHPFSEYDNTALDKAWHELKGKILKYNEERGEKSQPARPSEEQEELKRQEKGKGTESARTDTLQVIGSRSRPASRSDASSRERRSADAFRQQQRGTQLSSSVGADVRTDIKTSLQALDGPALGPDAEVADVTGTPFIRAPSRRYLQPSERDRSSSRSRPQPHAVDSYVWDDAQALPDIEPQAQKRKAKHADGPSNKVAVGISRLHHVAMPELQLEPIYWRPVHDIAPVFRGTWFYKDTMLPVETAVANMLEAGYTELRPWSETWKDELRSAVDVGAAGEVKILHRLWPEQTKRLESRPGTSRGEMIGMVSETLVTTEPETPETQRDRAVEAACDIIDISAGVDGADNKAAGTNKWGASGTVRTYATAGVIYANATEAHILKPNLQPSSYYGRRPLANYINKGRKLGIAVVRGFDQAAWDKLHPPKKGAKMAKAREGVSTSQSGAPPNTRRKSDAELAQSERAKVTDLVLVIHGIGQKLSERMESFHFTHAINAFRREVSVELGTDAVKAKLRKDAGGIMVLPVNWRHGLSFEEGGYRDGPEDPTANEFTLKDITPETLPSVRNIVSDVMLDIPYYLSHHQPKMIAAVIKEANRIYKLWCTNNPGFSESGRVHIIAHSLGSVMAVDILSRQPTHLPQQLEDPTVVDLNAEPPLTHLLFNTSALFLCGSPAGFFLLLKKASLQPRLDKHKFGSDKSSNTPVVCGMQDTYGCLAVDNIYNIINPYDPVSYRLNAAVDATYSQTLKTAWIPSATSSWFSSSASGSSWFYSTPEGGGLSVKAPALPRLPSNVELETHNFSREEIAEQRMFLLNDNGQIDFMLKYGGGPLEIQYLTMLGAHSSYWILRDFTRMIVLECGRELGREGALMGMRAVKRKVQLTP